MTSMLHVTRTSMDLVVVALAGLAFVAYSLWITVRRGLPEGSFC